MTRSLSLTHVSSLCSPFTESDLKFARSPSVPLVTRPSRRYGGRITGSWKCDSSEITIEFPAFSPTSFSSTPRLSVFKLRFLPPLCLSDGSITGAMLRELLKLSLSGCVSSNVSAWAFQPAHRAGKRKERRRWGGGAVSPVPQMMPAGSHRTLNFAGWFSPVFCLMAPRLRFTDRAILGLSAWWGLSSCIQQKKMTTTK